MANRRMFSKRIINSARFLKMGIGAQALYFHLCMNADDDGAVEAFSVRRMVGANDDDLSNLVGRGFLTVLDVENEIYLINDWLEHNQIRADRKVDSIYLPLIKAVAPDVPLIEPRQRKDRPKSDVIEIIPGQEAAATIEGQPHAVNGTSQGQPRDNHGTATGRHRLGKDSLDQVKLDQSSLDQINLSKGEHYESSDPEKTLRFRKPTIKEIEEYCEEKKYTHVDAEMFINYYENVDWKIKKEKMKSWKLAVANWEKRQIAFEAKKSGNVEIVQHNDAGQVPSYWEV